MKSNLFRNLRIGPIAGMGVGSTLMYLFDPQHGAKRRARIYEKAIHVSHKTEDLLDKGSRDFVNRGKGLISEVKHFSESKDVTDDVLIARVRSKLGRYTSHPHSVEVLANHGIVTLKGLILEDELNSLLFHLNQIRGLKKIINQLMPHKQQENLPSLQGGVKRTGEKIDILQASWAPSTRLVMGGAGAVSILLGLTRRGPLGTVLSACGIAALSRALTNLEFQQLIGVGKNRTAIRVQKMTNIDAPVERVYEFWSNFENFPKFLSDVQHVRVSKGIQSHWSVTGPAGTPISWDAIITRRIPNKHIAWKTMPSSTIPNSGQVKFRPNEQGGTRIDLDLSYFPPVGALGHFAAHLFGSDPKSKLDEALAQIKTLIEQGPSDRQLKRIAS